MSVRRCQQEVSSREFVEWMAFNRLEPFGLERADLGAASIQAVIANVNRDEKKRPRPFTVDEFMPKFGEEFMEEEVLSPEETLERAKAIFSKLAVLTDKEQ